MRRHYKTTHFYLVSYATHTYFIPFNPILRFKEIKKDIRHSHYYVLSIHTDFSKNKQKKDGGRTSRGVRKRDHINNGTS